MTDKMTNHPLKFTEEEQETLEGFANAIDNALEMSDEDFEAFKKDLARELPIGANEMLKGLDEARAELKSQTQKNETTED